MTVTSHQPADMCAHEAYRRLATYRAAHLTRLRVTVQVAMVTSAGAGQHSRLRRYRGVMGSECRGRALLATWWRRTCRSEDKLVWGSETGPVRFPGQPHTKVRAGQGRGIPAQGVEGAEASGVSAKEAGAGGLPHSPSLSPWSPLGGVSATGVSARGGLMSPHSRRGSQ